MKLKLKGEPREFEVELLGRDGPALRVRIDGEEFTVRVDPATGAISHVHDTRRTRSRRGSVTRCWSPSDRCISLSSRPRAAAGGGRAA